VTEKLLFGVDSKLNITFDEEYNEFLHEYQKTLKPKIRE
jgi:hypothetical protein